MAKGDANIIVRFLARLLRPVVIEILHECNIDPRQVRAIRQGLFDDEISQRFRLKAKSSASGGTR